MIRAVIKNPTGTTIGFEFLGLWLDERGDAQVVLRDLTVTGLYNIVVVHPSKVQLSEESCNHSEM